MEYRICTYYHNCANIDMDEAENIAEAKDVIAQLIHDDLKEKTLFAYAVYVDELSAEIREALNLPEDGSKDETIHCEDGYNISALIEDFETFDGTCVKVYDGIFVAVEPWVPDDDTLDRRKKEEEYLFEYNKGE